MSIYQKDQAKKSALIVGCGYIGEQLMSHLANMGWFVHGIRRKKSDDPQMLAVDVSEHFSIDKKFDTIFYLVAADRFDPESYKKAYVTGIANTIAAVKAAGMPSRIIFVSSTSLFSENNGSTVDESSPIDQSCFSKKCLKEGESIVAKSGLPYSIVRFSGIYGPGRYRLVNLIKEGVAKLKSLPCISNRIHRDDCVGILSHLANLKTPKPIYIASDCEPTEYNEILLWLSKQLQVSEPSMEAEATYSNHMSNKRCSNELLLASGYEFKFPSYREGFKAVL